jgi:hypothetical protein
VATVEAILGTSAVLEAKILANPMPASLLWSATHPGLLRTVYYCHFVLFMYYIQHCFICCPSDFTVSEDAGIEPRTVATLTLAVRGSNHSVRSHPQSVKSHPQSARSHPQSAKSQILSFHSELSDGKWKRGMLGWDYCCVLCL